MRQAHPIYEYKGEDPRWMGPGDPEERGTAGAA